MSWSQKIERIRGPSQKSWLYGSFITLIILIVAGITVNVLYSQAKDQDEKTDITRQANIWLGTYGIVGLCFWLTIISALLFIAINAGYYGKIMVKKVRAIEALTNYRLASIQKTANELSSGLAKVAKVGSLFQPQ